MNKFEMTERGKIVVAIILVTVLLVIPTIIILVSITSCSRSEQPGIQIIFQLPGPRDDYEQMPVIESTPLPSLNNIINPAAPDPGSNQDTQDTTVQSSSDDTDNQSVSTAAAQQSGHGNENTEVVPVPGPVGLNIAEGTMNFLFFPDIQTTFDDDTLGTFVEFLSSPKNTSNALIRVQIPNISDADEEVFMSALMSAFSQNNLTESRLLLVKSSTRVTERHFEAALSYTIPSSNQK